MTYEEAIAIARSVSFGEAKNEPLAALLRLEALEARGGDRATAFRAAAVIVEHALRVANVKTPAPPRKEGRGRRR